MKELEIRQEIASGNFTDEEIDRIIHVCNWIKKSRLSKDEMEMYR